MIINSQRTIYGLQLGSAILAGLPHVPKLNTTLNEKFGILPNEPAGLDTKHSIKYLALGVGGSTDGNGVGYSYSQHSPLDAALFQHVPFIIRTVDNDISIMDQAKYRMRVTSTIAGIEYHQYYLKVLSAADISMDTYRISTGGTETVLASLDINTSERLEPAPLSNDRTYGTGNDFVSTSLKIKFALSPNELSEISTAIDILFGTQTPKHLTEIAICGGLDKEVGNTVEAIQTQIYFHAGVNLDLLLTYDQDIGYLRAIELAGSEPLYV